MSEIVQESRRCRSPFVFAFALPDGGGKTLHTFLSQQPDVEATNALGALLLPSLYGLQLDGLDAEFNGFGACRTARKLMDEFPSVLRLWQEKQRELAEAIADTLVDATGALVVADCFPGSYLGAALLAELLPEAHAIVVKPHPLELLAAAYEASDGSADRLRAAEERYLQVHSGPERIVQAISAFGSRALVLDQNILNGQGDVAHRKIRYFMGLETASDETVDAIAGASPRWLALAGDVEFFSLAKQYIAHLEPILPQLGYDATALLQGLNESRENILIERALVHFDAARFEAIGIRREELVAIFDGLLDTTIDNVPNWGEIGRRIAIIANAAGEGAFADGKADIAEAAIELAVETDPTLPTALNNLGVLAWQRQEPERAIEYFTRAYAAEPANRNILDNLISALIETGRIAAAKSTIAHYLCQYPDDQEMLVLSLQL